MNSINLKRFTCDQCGYNEDVEENKKPVIIQLIVAGVPYQYCPDCVYETKIWQKHVKHDDLRNQKLKRAEEDDPKTDERRMEYLNEKTNELVTISRPWNKEVKL